MNGLVRGCATPLSFITFLGVGITGILLLLGVRGPLGEVHEWLGIAFIVALVLHLARNWRGVLAMLSTRPSKIIMASVGVVTALLIFAALPLGGGNAGGHGRGHGGGHGPWAVANRMANAPIATVAPALGISGDQAVARLRSGGVPVDGPQETLSQIARDHDQSLPRLFGLMLAEG